MSDPSMHKEYLLSALAQAQLGRGLCAPNPSVGAVAVQHGQIIAKAWHEGAGSPHAEQVLLSRIPPSNQETTLYVTLEPCNHWGRTPPCVEAIIAHGIKCVVFAYKDPNPIVAKNHTPTILRQHGIEVIHYPLPEIDRFYQSYHYWMQTHKPWVTVKMAQSLDGYIAGACGKRVQISNAACGVFTHEQRKACDVILTTSRTILQDNPQFTVRLDANKVESKPLAVLDAHLSLGQNVSALQWAKQGHIYYDSRKVVQAPHKGCQYYPIPMQEKGLDLDAVLGHLGALGYHDVWVEAGAQLFTALHHAHLVQRTYIYISPHIIGHTGLSLYSKLTSWHKSQAMSWQVMDDNVILTIDWSF
ncbi:MAG TPA: bifunctional diaminohydroxyphosphoribosylaminopyrimidine deaminase/5-amino-6-(5-phosphoribosylamino)uracil reductase RibD [Legionellaceae bacterium]|nr:bifunctional diaminohydroxyphosphoribosylaminopyrimidine deaminase/5-amino-6-(5-phosphoribosylamino)uracil reductase RibD [Legionellaceae bacterium]